MVKKPSSGALKSFYNISLIIVLVEFVFLLVLVMNHDVNGNYYLTIT